MNLKSVAECGEKMNPNEIADTLVNWAWTSPEKDEIKIDIDIDIRQVKLVNHIFYFRSLPTFNYFYIHICRASSHMVYVYIFLE